MNKKAMSALMLAGAVSVGIVTPIASHAAVNIKNVKSYDNALVKVSVSKSTIKNIETGKRDTFTTVKLKTKNGTFKMKGTDPNFKAIQEYKNKVISINGSSFTQENVYYVKGKKKVSKENIIQVTSFRHSFFTR